jgi:hypothetical protein
MLKSAPFVQAHALHTNIWLTSRGLLTKDKNSSLLTSAKKKKCLITLSPERFCLLWQLWSDDGKIFVLGQIRHLDVERLGFCLTDKCPSWQMSRRQFMLDHKLATSTLSSCTCFEGQQWKEWIPLLLRCGRPRKNILRQCCQWRFLWACFNYKRVVD